MSSKPIISVVIPSYNDCSIIRPYYEAITSYLEQQQDYDYELIYVDDGSSDGSQRTLTEIANSDDKVIYIELMRNYGQQRALFAGLSESNGDFVVTLDGDFQYDPEVITQLANALGNTYELASGIRKGRQDKKLDMMVSRLGNAAIANGEVASQG